MRRRDVLNGLGGSVALAGALPLVSLMGSIAPSFAGEAGTLVVADIIDDITTLDPNEVGELSAILALNQIYQPLVSYDVKDPSRIDGVLAGSWSVSEDGLTVTFVMNPKARFASGNPVTAHDAAYSLQRVIKLKGRMSFILGQFGFLPENVDTRIVALDGSRLRITLNEALSPTFLLFCLSSYICAIVDSRLVMQHEQNGDLGNAWLKAQHSAGSGPFILKAWTPGECVEMVRNDSYWSTPAKLQGVVLRHIPESSKQLALLKSGEVDIANKLARAERESANSDGALNVLAGVSGTIFYAGLNVRNPVLAKPEVWQAMKYLVDYDGISSSFGKGVLEVHQTFLPRGFLGAIEDRPFNFDPQRARGLLDQAGVAEGTELKMLVWDTAPYIDIARSLETSMAKGGIALKLELVDGKVWLSRYLKHEVDIWLGIWGPDYPDPHSNARALSINAEWSPDKSDGPIDRFGWKSDRLSKRSMEALREKDVDKRRAIYEEVQREHMMSSPFVFGFQEVRAVAMRKPISGLELGAVFSDDRYWNTSK